MEKLLRFDFTGRKAPRSDFLRQYYESVALFLHQDQAALIPQNLSVQERKSAIGDLICLDREFHTILREAIKNIYDHNGCWGYAEFKLCADDIVLFNISNLDNPTPEINEDHSEKSVNYGFGLGILLDSKTTKSIFIGFESCSNTPYSYKGAYRIKNLGE
ncbi:MAG: hypothetical protein WCV73_05220 [Patescibacteria group bacterium]|jgi:hypothetical protein